MPKEPRTTDDPVGQKLLQVLREKGRQDDLKHLAKVFDVRVQSTYDWIKYGRISKDRYATLVQWSGRPLEWWFDVPSSSRPPWPFPQLQEDAIAAMDPLQIARLEGALILTAAQLGLDLGNALAA